MDREGVDAVREDFGSHEGDEGHVKHGSVDDPDVLDFSANTNPLVPEGAREVYESAFEESRSYPDDDYDEFREAAADHVDCDPARVVPTAGGLAAIRLAIQTAVHPGDSVLVPYPSFSEYAREVELQGADPEFVPHDEILDADPTDHAMAIVCNPNNPTGDAYDQAALRGFADRCRGANTTLLVDEAFLGFTDHSSLAGTEGVVVARSLTKLFGLPGLRTGFAVATGNLHERITTARMPWALGTPAAATGAYCMRQRAFVDDTRARVAAERARMRDRLESRFEVHDSTAPFLLLDAESSEAVDEVVARASDAGVAIRDARTFRDLDSHLRVAVRLPDENDRLLDALDV